MREGFYAILCSIERGDPDAELFPVDLGLLPQRGFSARVSAAAGPPAAVLQTVSDHPLSGLAPEYRGDGVWIGPRRSSLATIGASPSPSLARGSGLGGRPPSTPARRSTSGRFVFPDRVCSRPMMRRAHRRPDPFQFVRPRGSTITASYLIRINHRLPYTIWIDHLSPPGRPKLSHATAGSIIGAALFEPVGREWTGTDKTAGEPDAVIRHRPLHRARRHSLLL